MGKAVFGKIQTQIKLPLMKLRRLSLVVFIICAFHALSAQKSVPDVDVYTLDGKQVNLKDYIKEEKITVLSFWASWCKPCINELNTIVDFYPEWQKKYNVEILAITIDTRRALAKVPGIVSTNGWEYTILSEPNNSITNALQFRTIPQTFLVDQAGNIVYSHNGYNPGDEYELEDQIKELSK